MKVLGFTDESVEKLLTPLEARVASETNKHYEGSTSPLTPIDKDKWTDTTSGITYTWFQNTWVELS